MAQGGKREGAGRKKLSNRYKEQTQPIRVPVSLLPTIQVLLQKKTYPIGSEANTPFIPHPASLNIERPLFAGAVSAGTPFSVDDHIDHAIDLNAHLIENAPTTFFVRVAGDSMTGAHIFDGDLLIVDRSPKPKPRDIVVAVVEGDLTVKRFMPSPKGVVLQSENPDHPSIHIEGEREFSIWGIVMHVIHKVR